jgi:hypothetical protein
MDCWVTLVASFADFVSSVAGDCDFSCFHLPDCSTRLVATPLPGNYVR